jgi:hypothetical protein
MSNFIPFVLNENTLTVMVDSKPVGFKRSSKIFDAVLNALKNRDLDAIRSFVNIRNAISVASAGAVTLADGNLYYKGQPIQNTLADRIANMFNDGFDINPLLRFLDNLMQNPSQRAINELYGFLAACSLPLTEDGHFLAYKMVRNDFRDIYTGSMDNTPGSVIEMPRAAVDDDAYRTCSRGLHFASLEYVENGGYGNNGRGDRLVVLKINPRDVVSIPVDYNNSKGRACKYLILEEIQWTDRIRDLYVNLERESVVDSCEDDDNWDESDWDVFDEDDGWDDSDTDGDYSDEDAPVVPARSLSDKTVRDIRKALALEWTLTEIANHYGTSRRTVARIRDGESYTDVV